MQPSRKLAAILSSDVVGYSRLVEEDERATIETLTTYRRVMSQHIVEHGGRVVDSPGDALLAEFPSAVEAVRCAVEIQRDLSERNALLPENHHMWLRIGVDVGDIIEQESALYGDGVNIAARLQALAEPGGIIISGKAFEEVESKLPLAFEDLGTRTVKNIAKSVRVYRVMSRPGAAAHRAARPKRQFDRRWRTLVITVIGLAVVAGLAVTGWQFGHRPEAQPSGLPLPDGPSIAVLPFTNMSEDPQQEYFADGITDDLITDLTRLRGVFVIARNSTFKFKGQSVDLRKVARDLGVRHVLEGGVRKVGNRVRINVQLIDAGSGAHVWAERFDREYDDIFKVQDEIRRRIVTELDVHLAEGEAARVWRQTTNSPEAYDYFLRATNARMRFTREDVARAKQLCEQALKLDPKFAMAMVELGRAHRTDAYSGWSASPAESYEKSLYWMNRALSVAPSLSEAYNTLGEIYMEYNVDHDRAVAYLRKAVDLDPNNARNNIILVPALARTGKPEEAIEFARKAMRLNPNPPGFYFNNLGTAYQFAGRLDEAIATYQQSIAKSPDFIWSRLHLTLAYAQVGRWDEARGQAKEVLRINPNFSLEHHGVVAGIKDPEVRREVTLLLNRAGLK